MKNCLLSAAAQLHRPLSWLCFQMYALLLLQLMDHRKQVTRLGIPFRPEHPYDTHARSSFEQRSSLCLLAPLHRGLRKYRSLVPGQSLFVCPSCNSSSPSTSPWSTWRCPLSATIWALMRAA
ncbi:hypothetical protein B1J45_24515 [Salmonella enterica subsp. enterica serovar Typhimurium]|nr:hypothetical protein [Salmonella enterica subsp. enterica serovar Adelaide]EAO6469142.1 hypothetical protein [Salmonella enterica subsp. enterica serovar Johannesburg]EBM8207425.1 hypothetical protein [Salmonella enterica subsp. enterica serovar Senftenberg]EDF6823819.1 hypothetical protein [Salmonella enterica subsp. enterica serovar Typhimurium]EFN9512445.1 hypothetical protein [Escherichia coli]HAD9334943.1 hypothetical protein [Salmonella enterica]